MEDEADCLKFLQASKLSEKMSSNNNNNNNNLSTAVPILDRTNYRVWASQMSAFLMSTGTWLIVNGTDLAPADPAELRKWNLSDTMANGNMILRIGQNCRDEVGQTSKDTWDNLAAAFGTIGISKIFGDFRTLVNFKISGTQHPGAEIVRFNTAVEQLKANSVTIADRNHRC
jgi:hypothetical protein